MIDIETLDCLLWTDWMQTNEGDLKIAAVPPPKQWTKEEIAYLQERGYDAEKAIEYYSYKNVENETT